MSNVEVTAGERTEKPPHLLNIPVPEDITEGEAAERRTPLFSLKEKRAKIINKLHKTLEVQRWGGDEDGDGMRLFVTYRPLSAVEVDKANSAALKKRNDDEWAIKLNCQFLVTACVGVYATLDDNQQKYSLRPGDEHGALTRFDSDLARNLGLSAENSTAIDTVRELFLTDGDIMGHATAVLEWSGLAAEEADEDFPQP